MVIAFFALNESLRGVDVYLRGQWPLWRTLGGISFLAMCTFALVLVHRAWPRPLLIKLWPSDSSRRALGALLVVGIVANEAFYNWKLIQIVSGTLTVHAPGSWIYMTTAVLLAPIVEEWLFRGVLWELVRAQFRGRGAGFASLVITSLMFGAFHWTSVLSPSWIAASGTPVLTHSPMACFWA